MAITATQNDSVSLAADKISYDLVETDVDIITSRRRRIPAHSGVLSSASPVLNNIIKKLRKSHGGSSKRVVKILGVPCDAVSVFVRFLYSPRLSYYHGRDYSMADHYMVIAGDWKTSDDGSWKFSIDKHKMSRIVTLSPTMSFLEMQNNVLKEFFSNGEALPSLSELLAAKH